MLEIVNFVDCPAALPTVAGWIHAEFWADKPGHSPESMLMRLREGRRDSLPVGYVAFDSDRPVGTVSLIACDLEERVDLSPWLAALYVLPEFRGTGVGKELINFCKKSAAELGFESIFLYSSIPEYYEKLGAVRFAMNESRTMHIIRFDL